MRGSEIVKVVPCPTSLVTRTDPFACCAKPQTWGRPRPVPLPTSFVLKNGSKARVSTSGGMPWPVSLTAIATLQVLPAAGDHVLGPDAELPALRHGIAGVHGQVDQGNLSCDGVDLDRPRALGEVEERCGCRHAATA